MFSRFFFIPEQWRNAETNQIKDSELLSPATTQILNEIQNLSNRNVTSTVQNINKK